MPIAVPAIAPTPGTANSTDYISAGLQHRLWSTVPAIVPHIAPAIAPTTVPAGHCSGHFEVPAIAPLIAPATVPNTAPRWALHRCCTAPDIVPKFWMLHSSPGCFKVPAGVAKVVGSSSQWPPQERGEERRAATAQMGPDGEPDPEPRGTPVRILVSGLDTLKVAKKSRERGTPSKRKGKRPPSPAARTSAATVDTDIGRAQGTAAGKEEAETVV